MRVLVTGANGFVGKFVCDALVRQGHIVRAVTREAFDLHRWKALCKKYFAHSDDLFTKETIEFCQVKAIDANTDWEAALAGVNAVIHLAARVHVMKDSAEDPLKAFREVNTDGTRKLAFAAQLAGVKRFVYLSTIKVNGESTQAPFRETDEMHPQDFYSHSKAEAEIYLRDIALKGSMQYVIVRPPLVYGPGVKGNFQKLWLMTDKGLPLPFKRVNNLRSLISVYNLADFLVLALNHVRAGNEIFLIADQTPISIEQLVSSIAKVKNTKLRLIYLSPKLLNFVATLLGKESMVQRLYGSLEISTRKAEEFLSWQGKNDFETVLQSMVDFSRAND